MCVCILFCSSFFRPHQPSLPLCERCCCPQWRPTAPDRTRPLYINSYSDSLTHTHTHTHMINILLYELLLLTTYKAWVSLEGFLSSVAFVGILLFFEFVCLELCDPIRWCLENTRERNMSTRYPSEYLERLGTGSTHDCSSSFYF